MSFKKKNLILPLSTCTIIPHQQLASDCMSVVVIKAKFFKKYIISLKSEEKKFLLINKRVCTLIEN